VKRIASIVIILLAVSVLIVFQRDYLISAIAQNSSKPETSPSQAQPTPKEPASSQGKSTFTLDCGGCHGPGKTLPYLGGALFHEEAHAKYDQGFHAKAKHQGAKAATCVDCHAHNGDLTTILPASDTKSTINRANLAITCGKCHGNASTMLGTNISNRPFISYQESVHARAISRGNLSAAVCSDCHGSHEILPASDSRSTISKMNIPATCGKCHSGIASEFNQSVHGQAVARGVSRSPVCTDCHGIHSINKPTEPGTSNGTQAMATDTCAHCHEGVTLTQEFGIQGDRVSSYKDSYHGMASTFGSKIAANCASCHGVHNILPSSNPRSMINAANLPQTCGQCHPGATQNFTNGKVHLNTGESKDYGSIGTKWVRRIYLPLIFLLIGGMVFHNALVWRKKTAEKRRHEHRSILRLSLNQRVQHWLLLTSFSVLVISGFALQYPDSWLGWLVGSSEVMRRMIHRVAAVVMIVVGVYHVGYLFVTKEGRTWVRDMAPRVKDFRDVLQNFGYYLGLKIPKPRIARFGYAEKAEYWAVVWGTVIMGLTGLMIWFKLGVFKSLARWWIDIALAVHFYEAVLATLAIIVWHFYQVIFDPDVYPINFAFYDGKVSDEHYKEEHALAYQELKDAEKAAEDQRAVAEESELEDVGDTGTNPADNGQQLEVEDSMPETESDSESDPADGHRQVSERHKCRAG
jgi:formate dehydrogenase gamma subunit